MALLPDSLWRNRKGFIALCNVLDASDGATRIVGGAVRDWLLEIEGNDIDLATHLLPDAVMQRLKKAGIKAVPTGIAHGTVTAVLDGHPIEITTLRRDVSTDGRRATIAYTDDWQQDAARRDFTINALYADPLTGEVHDYYGGLDDLEHRRVRFIGDPSQRIAEDHLRILRYFRFLTRFGALPPDAHAYEACIRSANSMMALSRERIADELLKLLALPDPVPVLKLMVEGGIFIPIVPEISQQGLEHLRQLLSREEQAAIAPPSNIVRLAALLPDDPAIGGTVATRLKLSNKARKRIVTALTPPLSHDSAQELAFHMGIESATDQILLRPELSISGIGQIKGWEIPQLPISGKDIIALGIEAGPDVARLLGELRDTWARAGFPQRAETEKMATQLVSDFRDSIQ